MILNYKVTKNNKILYKTPTCKGWKQVYNRKGRPSSAFTKLVKQGASIHKHITRKHVFNELTQRFVNSKSKLDKRFKTPTLRPRFNKHVYKAKKGRFGFQTVTHFNHLPEMVSALFRADKKSLSSSFTLNLQSANVLGAKWKHSWNSYYAFANWWKSAMGDNEGGSDGKTSYDAYVEKMLRKGLRNPMLVLRNVRNSISYGGGCYRKRNKTDRADSVKIGLVYDIYTHNVESNYHNCGLECMKYMKDDFECVLSNLKIRKEFGMKTNKPICPEKLIDIWKQYNTSNRLLRIIQLDFQGDYDENMKYLLLHKNHYYVVRKLIRQGKQAEKIRELTDMLDEVETEKGRLYLEKKIKKLEMTVKRTMLRVRRGLLTYDFETRSDLQESAKRRVGLFDDGTYKYGNVLRDTICSITYSPLSRKRNERILTKTFVTTRDKSSARQFLEWLQAEHMQKRHYNCLAHNGSNFDSYLLLANMTEEEMLNNPPPHFRNLSILGMFYYGNVFRDTGCFLAAPLSKLCKDFQIDKQHAKLSDFVLEDGRRLHKYEICMYRPKLDIYDFVKLEHQDPCFWKQYIRYCEHDTISLFHLWKKFSQGFQDIITKFAGSNNKFQKKLLSKCALLQSPTISSVNKKLLEELNRVNHYNIQNLKLFYKTKGKFDKDKYNFLKQFKRGGVSHTHQPGKHKSPIMGLDICSQYPWAMTHMVVPTGKSWFVTHYNEDAYGFYHVKNMVFGDKTEDLKPVCAVVKKGSLNWRSGHCIDECYIDSEMLKYVKRYYDLQSFDVVKGLISLKSVEGKYIFGEYVNRLFEAKKAQDIYKKQNHENYNPSMRLATKLSINSLSGKLLADPAKYFSIQYCANSVNTKQCLNNVSYTKEMKDDKHNFWLICGLMMYSYSKMLLFDYIQCFPKKSDSIIQIETDGLYASLSDFPDFRYNLQHTESDFLNSMKLDGEELGNLKLEHVSSGDAIFLGKKKYFFYCEIEKEDIMRMLGIPKITIDENGSDKVLLTPQVYEEVFSGKDVPMRFSTIRKSIEGVPELVGYYTTRTVHSEPDQYKVYE